MSETTKDKTFTDEEQADLRAEVRKIMETEGLNQADIARQSGVAYGTFTAWMGTKYAGNTSRVAAEVVIWLNSRAEKRRSLNRMPKAPDFQMTPSAERFYAILQYAQTAPDFAVIAGGPGVGKTTVCEHYRDNNPNVFMATLEPCSGTVYPMLGELAEVMSIGEKVQTKLSRAIGRKVQGTGALIIIDEAQHADSRALDQLRALHDRYGVGILLSGNETVYARLEGEGRKASFAQLFSRIGMRITQSTPKPTDMCALIKAWDVTDGEEVRLLKAIARKPGALRAMTKTLKLASMLAVGAGEARGIKHIKQAYAQLNPSDMNRAA